MLLGVRVPGRFGFSISPVRVERSRFRILGFGIETSGLRKGFFLLLVLQLHSLIRVLRLFLELLFLNWGSDFIICSLLLLIDSSPIHLLWFLSNRPNDLLKGQTQSFSCIRRFESSVCFFSSSSCSRAECSSFLELELMDGKQLDDNRQIDGCILDGRWNRRTGSQQLHPKNPPNRRTLRILKTSLLLELKEVPLWLSDVQLSTFVSVGSALCVQ